VGTSGTKVQTWERSVLGLPIKLNERRRMSELKHRVWEIVSKDGDLEAEFSKESVDAQREALKYSFMLWMNFNDLKMNLHNNYHAILGAVQGSEYPDREMELLIGVHPDKEALTAFSKGEDYEPFLWKKLEPKINV